MKLPIEHEYSSCVAYTRDLELYTAWVDEQLTAAQQCTDRGMEVERQMSELKTNYKAVAQATHVAFTERIAELEERCDDYAAHKETYFRLYKNSCIRLTKKNERIAQLEEALKGSLDMLNWYYDQYADSEASKVINKINEVIG